MFELNLLTEEEIRKERIIPDNSLRIGMGWTKSSDGEGLIRVSENRNCFFYTEKHSGSIGLRPCIVYSEIEPFITSSSIVNNDSENFKVTFGEYPQDVVDSSYADYLEKQYKNRKLKQTGKIYTTNGADLYEGKIFVPIKYLEYQARDGLKYIRYICTKNDKYSLFDLKKIKYIGFVLNRLFG